MFADTLFAQLLPQPSVPGLSIAVLLFMALMAVCVFAYLTVRYIPNHLVGVVEKLWSSQGSVAQGCIIALNGEAGYQADLLRGGFHFHCPRWQYRHWWWSLSR